MLQKSKWKVMMELYLQDDDLCGAKWKKMDRRNADKLGALQGFLVFCIGTESQSTHAGVASPGNEANKLLMQQPDPETSSGSEQNLTFLL